MYPHLLQDTSGESEEQKHYIPNDAQHTTLAAKPNDIRAVYDPALSQAGWIPIQPQLEQPWEVSNLLNDGQYSQAYDDGMLVSNAEMELLVHQWLHKQTPPPFPLISSVHLPEYTETNGGSIVSPSSEGDLPPHMASTNHMRTYGSVTTSSPATHPRTSNAISPTEPLQLLPHSATYFDTIPSTTTTMPMAYSQAQTTLEDYQSLAYPTTTGFQIEPSYTAIPSSLLNQSADNYSTLQTQSQDLNDYILNIQRNQESLPCNSSHTEDSKEIPRSHTHEQDFGVQYNFSLEDLKTVSKQISGPRRKTGQSNRKVKDSTALMKMPKSEPVSRQTSCWRCRRYKKPCNGKGSVCDACVTSGFRIWSADIGCRKGDMNEFVIMLIPSEMESNPIIINDSYLKPPSFRQSSQMYPSDTLIPISAAKGDAWDQFLYKVQSTGIHGPGVLELLHIAIRYQRKFKKPDKVIVGAIRAMSVAADVFRLLVATKDSDMFTSTVDLNKVFTEARKALSTAAGYFLRNCLTGRIKQFFSTFMASNINVFAFIMIGDAINAIPAQYRSKIWPNVRKTLLDLRQVLYPTARDLLNALSKGSQPLNMSCWEMVQENTAAGDSPKWVRNAEGMRLVDDCEATFDAMRDLQQWRNQFSHLLCGDAWMSTQPLAVDLLLISSVSRLFITPKS